MKSGEEEFTWERFHNNHILLRCDLFIIINVQKNNDLKSVVKRSFPDNWKDETIKRISDLKNDLSFFWEENKYLINQ